MKSVYMQRALKLAEKARGRTSPNPMVGAVIVKAGKIVGEGHHEQAGKDHAEIVALKKAKTAAKGATLYSTLEPCCHKGRTGPCTDAVIASGIKKVVIAMRDPNPLVSGKGIARLKKAGITVMEGLLQKESKKLNEAYEKFITKKMPYVTLKAACSLDARMAADTGDSKWITNELSRKRVHEMRSACDLVMVGINTVLNDDPRLNVRPIKKGVKQPIRLVADTNLKTPPDAKILHSQGGEVWIACGPNPSPTKVKILEQSGAKIIPIPLLSNRLRIGMKKLMKKLAAEGVVSVLLEGGGTLFTSALSEGIVDRVALFYAPIILGGSDKYSLVQGNGVNKIGDSMRLKNVTFTQLQENMLIEGEVGG